MPLRLLPGTQADASAMTLVFFAAFHPEDPFESLIYPRGATPKAMEHVYRSIAMNFNDPSVMYLKVVDTEIAPDDIGSDIIAWARWKMWKTERPPSEWDVTWKVNASDRSAPDADGLVDDVDVGVEDAMHERLSEMRRKHVQGKPCIYMSMLCTRPLHRRRGAASMLLNWGLDLADSEQLDIYAQASPMILSSGGASNMRFSMVESFSLNVEALGREKPEGTEWPVRKTLMRRRPEVPWS